MWKSFRSIWLLFWAFVGIVSTVIGFAGIPDDIESWSKWVGPVMTGPQILKLAQPVAEIANFINQWWFRSLLVIAGILLIILLIIWPLRWFWKFRHRLQFRWSKIVTDQVWISKKLAIKVARESQWGRLKEPNVVISVNLLESLSRVQFTSERSVYGMSDKEKALFKFDIYLNKTVDSFCKSNPSSCRKKGEEIEIDEVVFVKFLDMAVKEDLYADFGNIPKFKMPER